MADDLTEFRGQTATVEIVEVRQRLDGRAVRIDAVID